MLLNENAPAAKAPANDSSHYYSWTKEWGWRPMYTPDKNYTLREARKAQQNGEIVVPSVTTYFRALHKQQLLDWKIEQAICYADANPRAGALIDEWVEMVASKADQASKPAADLGTAIHAAVEAAIKCEEYDANLSQYVDVVMADREAIGVRSLGVETCCGSVQHGYGGKCDEHAHGMMVLDIKSRKAKPGKVWKVPSYSTDRMQLAAYGYALFGDAFFSDGVGVVFGVATNLAGLLTRHVFPGKELLPAFEAFVALTGVWRFEHSFDPRVPVATALINQPA